MLSILLPIYKCDATDLISSLVKQGEELDVPYEIIAIDDFSNSEYDKENLLMNNFEFVEITVNNKNLGRSKTRNLLASKSKYDWLVFLDSDSEVGDFFLQKYISAISTNNSDVVCGGTSYSVNPPEDKEYLLHWKYGSQREAKPISERTKLGFNSFTSNNFATKSRVFTSVKFDESITEYGHEDTLLGKQLSEKGLLISHIDNSVLHLGLEKNNIFIEKSSKAIDTLSKLYKENKLQKGDVSILDFHLKHKRIIGLSGKYFKSFLKNRVIENQCLYCLDLYRLILLSENISKV